MLGDAFQRGLRVEDVEEVHGRTGQGGRHDAEREPEGVGDGRGMNMVSSRVIPIAGMACLGRNELVFQVCTQPLGRDSVPEL